MQTFLVQQVRAQMISLPAKIDAFRISYTPYFDTSTSTPYIMSSSPPSRFVSIPTTAAILSDDRDAGLEDRRSVCIGLRAVVVALLSFLVALAFVCLLPSSYCT